MNSRVQPEKCATQRKYIAYVVPHTHWDRAWYLPFEEFRIKLVRTFDKLLEIFREDSRFNAFSFDGQTVVLEDYLQIRPENEKVIRKLVTDGRLAVGPWYVLPDEFLVSGEAIIRNLLIGHRIASDFGRVMKAGYIPDPFGHISQIPQILRGFGIDSLIFSRGSGRKVRQAGLVFKWVGPDGESWVHAVLQAGMYVNLRSWGVPEGEPADTLNVDYRLALQQVHNLIDLMEKWKNPTRILLLNNGHDHLPAQPKVPDMIDYVNANQDRATLVQGTFEDFVVALREDVRSLASPPVRGELHEGMEVGLLSGIFSTRMYIKQANATAQTLLEKVCEPLSTFAWSLGADYPSSLLLYAWKELLNCHPHDDIGGCSVDSVHEDDMDRFRRVQQVGETLSRRALDDIARHVSCPAGRGLIVYNPLSFRNSREVKLSVPFRKEELPANLQLLDPTGAKVPAVVQWSRGTRDFGELSIAFLAEDVPACGYRLYTLAEAEEREPRKDSVPPAKAIENEFFKVTPNPDGTVNVREKETGITYKRLNFFEDVEDTGDEYDYSPLPASGSVRITSREKPARIVVVRSVPYKQSIEVSLELRVPRGLTRDRTARSRQMVSLPIRSTVTLYRGIRRVDFETKVENVARDHRLRAGFPTGIHASYAFAESKFDVVKRPLRFPRYTEKYHQPPVPTQHVETFVDIDDRRRGFALLNDGLPEYEARQEAGGVTLYQTLFRSVGWLSRGDLLTRKQGGAGPPIPTPGAQMPGTRTFRYSIVPHRGSWQDAALWRAGQSFTTPLAAQLCTPLGLTIADCGVQSGDSAPKKRRAVTAIPHSEIPIPKSEILNGAPEGCLPPEFSFLSVEPPSAVISAIKRSESGEAIIARFYNPTSRKVRARLHFFCRIAKAYLVRLDETRIESVRITGGNSVVVPLGPKAIITLELHWDW